MDTVFLVVDDPMEANFMEQNLKDNNYSVFKFTDLEIALKATKKNAPSLIVINVLTSEKEMITFCSKIKRAVSTTAIISLVDSENYSPSPYIDHFMTKPIRPKLLLSIIRSLMNKEVINWYPSIIVSA